MALRHPEPLLNVKTIVEDAESDRTGGELLPFARCCELHRHAAPPRVMQRVFTTLGDA
jgi:hypothetical protein